VAVSTGAELTDMIDALGAIPIDTNLVGVWVYGAPDVDGDTVLTPRRWAPVHMSAGTGRVRRATSTGAGRR
jgi:hypothetical protein